MLFLTAFNPNTIIYDNTLLYDNIETGERFRNINYHYIIIALRGW